MKDIALGTCAVMFFVCLAAGFLLAAYLVLAAVWSDPSVWLSGKLLASAGIGAVFFFFCTICGVLYGVIE